MFNIRLAGGHLYGKQLFTLLSLVVSLMTSFVLSFFPLDVLDEIWDLIEPVSEGFLTYSCIDEGDRLGGRLCYGLGKHCAQGKITVDCCIGQYKNGSSGFHSLLVICP